MTKTQFNVIVKAEGGSAKEVAEVIRNILTNGSADEVVSELQDQYKSIDVEITSLDIPKDAVCFSQTEKDVRDRWKNMEVAEAEIAELERLAEIGRAVEFFADKTDEHGESYHVPYIEDGNTYVTAVCHSEIQGIVKAYRESHACMDCETADGCDECRG